jgi:hypothetical protein
MATPRCENHGFDGFHTKVPLERDSVFIQHQQEVALSKVQDRYMERFDDEAALSMNHDPKAHRLHKHVSSAPITTTNTTTITIFSTLTTTTPTATTTNTITIATATTITTTTTNHLVGGRSVPSGGAEFAASKDG